MIDELPTRRLSLRGIDLDGKRVTLSFSISKKLYRCPGCRAYIDVGREHVLVEIAEPGADPYHQHWHRPCARAIIRELRSPEAVPSGTTRGPRRRRL